jgi:hypothetical protein
MKNKNNVIKGYLLLGEHSRSKNSQKFNNKNKKVSNILIKNSFNVIVYYFMDNVNSPKELINLIREKLRILLNIENFQLKENSTSDQTKQLLGLIKLLIGSLKKKTFQKKGKGKKKEKEAESQSQYDLIDNVDLSEGDENEEEDSDDNHNSKYNEFLLIPEYSNKLQEFLIEFIEPFITKSLFYQNDSSNELLYIISDISLNLSNNFLSENIFNVFNTLLSDNNLASGNSNWVLVKINCFLKAFFNKINDANENEEEKNLQSKFNNFVGDSVKNISSANITNTSHILNFLANLYNLARINYEKISTKNQKLLKLLNDSIIEIFKRIINLIDMSSNPIFYKAINLFFHCCITYINDLPNKTEKNSFNEKIEVIVLDYLKENTCDLNIITTIFPIIHTINSAKKSIYQKLFDFVYKSLVYNNNSNKRDNNNNNLNLDENFNFLNQENFNKSEIFPQILIQKNIELDTLNEKTIKYFENLIQYIDIRYIDLSGENIQKIYNLIGLLSFSKDKFYINILKNLLAFVFEISNRYSICHSENENENENSLEKNLEEKISLTEKKNNNNKILKASLPDPYKLKFCISLMKKILLPLSENLFSKKNEFIEKLNKSSLQEENCEWKFLKENNLKKKKQIKKNLKAEIEKEKSQYDQIQLKMLIEIMENINCMKNIFLLIPHKKINNKNNKFYENLVKEFSSSDSDKGNSVILLEDFISLKNEINKKILDSRIYFCLYEPLKAKEILDYYFSFDYYSTKERIVQLKKFSKDYKSLLKIFKRPEKEIFNSKIKLIYLYNHLDLFKNNSHTDLPEVNMREKITLLINKLILKSQNPESKKNYISHITYILIRLNNEKNKLSYINVNDIYNKTLKHYENFLDKIDLNETPSISLKTKISNMVQAYVQFVNFYILSPSIEYSNNTNNINNNVDKKKNNFQLYKIFEDLVRIKEKLFRQNFKEINYLAISINFVLSNILKNFPTSNYLIDKKLNSKIIITISGRFYLIKNSPNFSKKKKKEMK